MLGRFATGARRGRGRRPASSAPSSRSARSTRRPPTPISPRATSRAASAPTPRSRRSRRSRSRPATSARRRCCSSWWIDDGVGRLKPDRAAVIAALLALFTLCRRCSRASTRSCRRRPTTASPGCSGASSASSITTVSRAARVRQDFYGEPWGIDAPAAEQNLSRRVKTATAIHVEDPIVLTLDDPRLFEYPWIYFVEPAACKLHRQRRRDPARVPAARRHGDVATISTGRRVGRLRAAR